MKPVKKEMKFDGINFWYRDLKLDAINDKFIFTDSIPKQDMDAEKDRMLGRIMRCEVA